MCSSSFSWRKPLPVVLVVLMTSCAEQHDKAWVRVDGLDAGGFSVAMPQRPDAQHGTMVIDRDTVDTHIDILADSGVVYVAAWFELPDSLRARQAEETVAHIWPQVVARFNGTELQEEGPLGGGGGAGIREAWLMSPGGSRIGLVLRRSGDRMVLMNAAMPDRLMQPAQRRRMVEFLRSFQPRG